MKLTHIIDFAFDLDLQPEDAINFARDVSQSLGQASFIHDLEVHSNSETSICATLPVNAAMFGEQHLKFESQLVTTDTGARLEPSSLPEEKLGWAEVSGEATVTPHKQGSHLTYHFDIAIFLKLPKAEKWGGKALLKMVRFTAEKVLDDVMADFPKSIQAAAAAFRSVSTN